MDRSSIKALLESFKSSNQNNYDGMVTFSIQRLEYLIKAFDYYFTSAWVKPDNETLKIFYEDGIRYFKHFQKLPRFTSLSDKEMLPWIEIAENAWSFSSGTKQPITWKGKPLLKNCYDLALLQMMIYDLKPDRIIELGSWNGASADYMHSLCQAFSLSTQIYSFDIINTSTVIDPSSSVHYLYGDNTNQSTYEPYLSSIKGRTLLIEDSHVNFTATLDMFLPVLRDEDYIIVEDIRTRSGTKFQQFATWYDNHSDQLLCDNYYVDYFGAETSTFGLGILKYVRTNR